MKTFPILARFLQSIAIMLLLCSCSSITNGHRNDTFANGGIVDTTEDARVSLVFTGDIMAHEVNYSMVDYSRIYSSVKTLLTSADLCFGNLEMPVADTLPLSTYPRFNVHAPYLKAAVDAGFNVFSLANNHSNDQGRTGITATRRLISSIKPTVHASGLRAFEGEPMHATVIRSGKREIVFLAVTEILNAHDAAAKYVYYVAPTKKAREPFLEEIRRIRAKHPRAVVVLSIHCNEPEYVRTVSEAKRSWFRELADAGVDIVWGNHPHVMQEWEVADAGPNNATKRVLFMYSMGNFISGQRAAIDRENPDGMREYTGDSIVMKVDVMDGTLIATPVPVTNYTEPGVGPVVKPFDAEFVSALSAPLKKYYEKRYSLMQAYLPLPPMPLRAILD